MSKEAVVGFLEKTEGTRRTNVPLSAYAKKVVSILEAHDYRVIPQKYSPARKPVNGVPVVVPDAPAPAGGPRTAVPALRQNPNEPKVLRNLSSDGQGTDGGAE